MQAECGQLDVGATHSFTRPIGTKGPSCATASYSLVEFTLQRESPSVDVVLRDWRGLWGAVGEVLPTVGEKGQARGRVPCRGAFPLRAVGSPGRF